MKTDSPRAANAFALPSGRMVLAVVLLMLGGCATEGASDDAGHDAKGDAATTIVVDLGGADDEGAQFVDWSGGEVTPKMVRGPQGGQHIWVRTRSQGLWHKKARIDVTMTLIESGKVVKPGTVPVMPSLELQDDGSAFSPGITAYVKCPCEIVGRAVRVRAEIVDLYGLTGAGEATIRPTWDGDCSAPPSGNCAEQ